MPQHYLKMIFRTVFTLVALGATFLGQSQVIKPFTQRTSQYTPEKTIYNVKGDFTMFGNTNMTLQNYGDQTQNGNNVMQYVDIDDPQLAGPDGVPTFNSSSAQLVLSNENGALPECSNIIYAGLYWTGRAANAAPSANQFSVTREVVTGNQPFSNNYPALMHNQNVTGTTYNLTVSRVGSANNYYPRYTFSGGGNLYQFNFTNAAANMVSVSVNGGSAVFLPVTVTTVGFVKTATLNTPYTFSSGGLTISINQLIRDSRTDRTVVETQQASKVNLDVSGNTPITTSYTKNFDKRKVLLKGPGASGYTEFMAANQDILYPTDAYDFMYSGYVEVTDYVKTHGIGSYTLADMALIEGNGGGTGYYGGWGIVVIYENSQMRYRDITLFDGYAYVIGGTASNDLEISGFNTVQSGPVGLKLGILAGEGDRDITGDYFQIKRQSDNVFQSLNHGANSANNFFNASINVPGTRNPSLLNNTGLDLDQFTVPNPDNSVITNGQTSTTFRYGSIQDTYIINAMVMAVDAYIPEIEGELSAVTMNGQPAGAAPYTIEPGQDMSFKVVVRNRGTEALTDAKLIIPIPYNTDYVSGSASQNIYYTPVPTPNTVTFDPALGANGSLIWDIGNVPLPADPETILGDLTFHLTVTEDCALLQTNCTNIVQVNGSVGATGALTGVTVNNLNLILGHEANGNCLGNALPAPLNVTVNAADFISQNCAGVPAPVALTFCTNQDTIPITAVAGSFPAGSLFYNEYPVTGTSVQYTVSNPFPATAGTTTYYAVPPTGQGCYFAFTITVNYVQTLPIVTVNPEYCVGASAWALTATASAPGLNLYYFSSLDGAPQTTLVPSTATAGTFTYYVAEGPSVQCYGEKVPITVTVSAGFTLTAPAEVTFEGCGTGAITGLDFSESQVTITLAQFIAAGGSVSDTTLSADTPIHYTDVRSGLCPITVTRTFSAAGSCGEQSAVQQLTIQDTTAPTLSGLQAESTLEGCVSEIAFATPTATDNCEGQVTLTFMDATATNGCTTTVTRTWTATDACSNVATATQTVNFIDNLGPVISALPETTTINCGQTPEFAQAIANDNCGTVASLAFTDAQVPGACAGAMVYTRTWTATDSCGNQSTASQSIIVTDNTAPEITASAQNLNIQCSAGTNPEAAIAEWLASHGGAQATDACSEITWTNSYDGQPASCSAPVTVTFTATDACGNASVTQATLSIQDTTAPALPAIPQNLELGCDETVPAAPVLVASDACSGEISAEAQENSVPGSCPGSTVITRTWTFTDACQNSVSASQTITIIDTTAPEITTPAVNLNFVCGQDNNPLQDWLDNHAGAVAADSCSEVTWTNDYNGQLPVCGSPVAVNFTATDACGNAVSVTANFTLTDDIAPVAPAAPENITFSCGSLVPAAVSLTATDACSGPIVAQPTESTVSGACPNSYVLTRTWTFTDACGNASQVTQTITVDDTVPPVAPEAPAPITVGCAASVPAPGVLIAVDACSGEEISATGFDIITPGSCPNSFTIVRTWTFADACKNSVSISQNITVNDTTAPVFTEVPADVSLGCDAVPTAAMVFATDDCSAQPIAATLTETTTTGACAGSYTITRTWTATDACNNSAIATQTITVTDTTAPVFADVPADLTLECTDVPAAPQVYATDGCSTEPILAVLTETSTPGTCPGSLTLVRTWTATDACGNTATATQIITVSDNTGPVATNVPGDLYVNCSENVPVAGPLTATDGCSGQTFEVNPTEEITPGSCPNSYIITRTWTFTDACNNSSVYTQTITVNDTEGPLFAVDMAAEITVNCGEVPEAMTITANDGCSQTVVTAVLVQTSEPGTCPEVETITRVWTATDACGNATSMSQIIHVLDQTGPVNNTPFEETVNVVCDAIPAAPQLTFSDACSAVGEPTFVETSTTPENGSYVITRTWTVADACGNQSTFTQTVNVSLSSQAENVDGYVACNIDSSLIIDLVALLPAGTPTGGIFTDTAATGAVQGSSFAPNGLNTGVYPIDYVFGDTTCPATVRINMTVDDDCEVLEPCVPVVHNAFSPNGDGKNDIFTVTSFEDGSCITANRVEIYNRWGVLVFEMDDYNNQDRAFRGYSEGRVTVNKSEELPAGTYFYIISFTKEGGETGKLDGYLYLSR